MIPASVRWSDTASGAPARRPGGSATRRARAAARSATRWRPSLSRRPASPARRRAMSAPAKSLADTAAEFGLKPEEYDLIVQRLNREPNLVELGVFSVMWSEHCSYKSSRRQL